MTGKRLEVTRYKRGFWHTREVGILSPEPNDRDRGCLAVGQAFLGSGVMDESGVGVTAGWAYPSELQSADRDPSPSAMPSAWLWPSRSALAWMSQSAWESAP
jgi:hypothetical protein